MCNAVRTPYAPPLESQVYSVPLWFGGTFVYILLLTLFTTLFQTPLDQIRPDPSVLSEERPTL